MSVIQFPIRSGGVHGVDLPSRIRNTRGCPAWCMDRWGDHDFHYSESQAFQEFDDDGEVIYAVGGRLYSLSSGTPALVELIVWEAEDDAVITAHRGLLRADQAREVAGHLLRLADEAEGRTS